MSSRFFPATLSHPPDPLAHIHATRRLWEDVWGEHMHHGYYPGGQPRDDHVQAQVDMIERSLEWAGLEASVSGVDQILDVGCGIGGSSRHMARRWPGCVTRGITLSPVQARRANELAREQGLENRSTFQVADALNQPFDDSSFDLVWSMESGEHMPDKGKFVNELARVCAPGGRILIVTWCHRILREGEKTLPEDELQLLDRICEGYYLPRWCSVAEYARLCADEGLVDVRTADWSEQVSPFWRAVIRTALTWRGFVGLLRAGPATVRGGLVMPLMHQGLKRGTIRFNLITATKPR